MSVNESGLKRTIKRDEQLQSKLVRIRKNRDSVANKIQRITKKKSVTKADIQRLARYNSELVKRESEMTKIIEEISKNTKKLENYKSKVSKEYDKQLTSLMKSMKNQTITNKGHINHQTEFQIKLNDLTSEIKESVKQKEIIKFDIFLSHSSLDKAEYVSELSEKLEDKGLNVFEDVKVFKVGQSQTEMMNMGILNSRFVVVFLSSNFIESGWSDYEFKSFLNREINEKRIIILPIWHNVTFEEVQNYNPYLVDKFALDTSKYTLEQIVESIYQVVNDSIEELN